ncbi:MAG: hypothetical protein RLY70_4257 [Planctomycetota bacterium]|jgi:hypothetical protein
MNAFRLAITSSLLAVVLAGLAATGCQPKRRTRSAESGATAAGSREELDQAVDLMSQLGEIPLEKAETDLAYLLNRWIRGADELPEWKRDSLADRLPKVVRDAYDLNRLERGAFDLHDSRVLLEAQWCRDISEWAGKQPAPAAFTTWLATRQPALSRDDAEQLRIAERLFDWTIRNIQLDPLAPYVAEASGAVAGGATDSNLPPYLRGLPGPGYQRETWQTLLAGHGDAWERGRVFAALARQQGLETVVLAISDLNVSPRPTFWTVALLVAGEMFLFDPGLGLPLPPVDAQGTLKSGIATFADLRAHPEWLEAYDVPGDIQYGVRPTDLKNVVALIDLPPAWLSRRMEQFEKQLVGDKRMRVASQPTRLADRVRQTPGVNRVELWTVPWEAELFAATLAELAKGDPPPPIRARLAEDALFLGRSPLSLGRSQHFHGRFANDDDRKGAKGHYLDTRIPDDVLDRLGTDETAQRAMGLVRDRFESDNAWLNRLRITQIVSKTAKAHASYWLGLVHFETGQYEVAAEWFRNRTLELAGENPWKAGARYNLGRCLELQGQSVAARALYLEDKSPQRHGNLLRARLLLDTASSTER